MPISFDCPTVPPIPEPMRSMIQVLQHRVYELEQSVKYFRKRADSQSDQIAQLMGIVERMSDDGR
jgi:hypothetical protein